MNDGYATSVVWGYTCGRLECWLCAPVGAALVLASAAKFIAVDQLAAVLALVELPRLVIVILCGLIPGLEFAVGAALLLGWRSRALMSCAVATIGLFIAFLVLLIMVDPSAKCSCFGRLLDHWSLGGLPYAIARNCVFLLLLAVPTLRAFRTKARYEVDSTGCQRAVRQSGEVTR